MKLSEISIKRPVLASMMSLALVLFGLVGLSRLPVRELPDIDPPIINVSTVYPGASAAVVETQVTEILEETLTSVEGIKTMTSESREQVSSITIEFTLARSIDIAAQDVRDRVSRVRGRLPDDIDEPVIAKQDSDARPSMWIALYSDRYSTLELTDIAENFFKDRLQTVPGVSSVIFGGAKRFAIRLWLDSEKMAARGITVLDVENALRTQSLELPSGRVESWQRELSIETRGELKTPEEYNALVIKSEDGAFVRLQDVGRAEIGVEDERSVARYNSRPAVGIGVIKQSKANIIDVARGIKEELERLRPQVPEGLTISLAYDESVFVEKSVKEVWITLGIAFVLVVLTIYIFLHTFRATLVPAITIPVSIISTFGVLYLMDYSINIVTMLAFVLAIGLVVDDAIVVIENIHRHIEEGMGRFEAAITGMREIGFAIIATTVALVAVFLPMAFQTSVTGRLFIEFAVAISFGVVISTFVALTLAPMISARVLKQERNEDKKGLVGMFERGLGKVTVGYEKRLRWSMRHTWVIVLVSFLALLGAVFFYSRLSKEFLPEEDKGRLFCIVLAPEGSTSEYTDRMVKKMEGILSAAPEVAGYFAAVGLSGSGPGQASRAFAFIRLKDERDRHVRDIVGGPQGFGARFFGEIEGAMVIPIIPKAIGGGFSQPFQLVLQNQDLNELNRYAQELSQQLMQAGFLANVRSTFELNKPELRININRNRAATLGVTVESISRTLQILFGGSDLSKVNIKGKEYDVIVQLERASRLSPSDLERLYIRNVAGNLVQLNNVIDYDTGGGPSAINHFNRLRSATIEATPVGVPLGAAVEQTQAILKDTMPQGFRYEWDGEAADLIEAGGQTFFILILAIAIVYMVLAAQFESLMHPLTIMATLPLAAFGAFGSLYALGSLDAYIAGLSPDHWMVEHIGRIPAMGINLFSQIGMILLIGIVTKNGILLVDFARQAQEKGATAAEAMLEAGRIRLRPILMTALSTIAGILPIAIGFGAGAESRRPLGVAAVGGIVTSTFLTLFVIPVVYVMLSKISRKKYQEAAALVLAPMVFFSMSGCAPLGRTHTPPTIALPLEWKAEELSYWKRAEPADHLPRGAWWTIFGDEDLNGLESMAVKHNQNLKTAVANVHRARALARVNASEFYPTLEMNPEFERSRRSGNATTFSSNTGNLVSERYSIPFDFAYEIDMWGRVRRTFEAGAAEAEATAATYHTVLLTLTADVAQNYFLVRGLDAEAQILDEAIALRERAFALVKDRFDAGIISELDLHLADAELARARANKVDVIRRRQELENALAVLCGQLASDFSVEVRTLSQEPPVVPVDLPVTLLERRPDIARAEREVASANARIGVAETAFFPALSFSASAGLESADAGDLLDWDSRVWSLGPRLYVPLFQGGRNAANLEAAEAAYDATVAAYRQRVLEAVGEVESTLSTINLRAEQAKAQEAVLNASRRTADISISRYTQGLVTFLEAVDAERSRLDAELQTARVLSERLIAVVRLIKALGGGWNFGAFETAAESSS